jgi:hypothetical protein
MIAIIGTIRHLAFGCHAPPYERVYGGAHRARASADLITGGVYKASVPSRGGRLGRPAHFESQLSNGSPVRLVHSLRYALI